MYRVDLHSTLNKRRRVSLTSASKIDKKIEPKGLPLQAGNDSTITNCGFRNVCFRFGRGHLKNRHRSQCYPCASWL